MTPEENELLCRVTGDAPMGQLMRRHWMPACLSEEVAEPDGAPVRMRLLGEDLVAFRDTNGRLGVLDEHCPHRRASLVLGRNEECGLRCLYHGWKVDVDGNVAGDGLRAARQPDRRQGQTQGLSGARGRRASCGPTWARPRPCRSSSRRRLRRHRTAQVCDREDPRAVQLGADPRRPDRLGAFLEPALLRHGAGQRRCRQGDRHHLAAALDRQGAAHAMREHQLRLPLRGDPQADPQSPTPMSTCARPSISRRSPA